MIGKQTKSGMYPVWVYDPAIKRKRYVGQRPTKRGPGSARELELEKISEFQGEPTRRESWTCEEFALEHWLPKCHGAGTRRPSPSTKQQNASSLGARKLGEDNYGRPFRAGSFLAEFGERPIAGGITRHDALAWAGKAGHGQAKVVAAMLNDAIDAERAKENPFANRRLPNEQRGRRDIEPLTEAEVAALAELALIAHGDRYGRVVAGWIAFRAWTGVRPGEAASREWDDCDLDAGLLTVPRIKGHKQTDEIVLPPAAVAALRAMPEQRAAADRHRNRLFLTSGGKPYTIGSFAYYWKPIRTAFVAGLKPGRRRELEAVKGALDPYALRHFCGSVMADRGANEFDISAQLGNSPEVCRSVYIHTYRERTQERNRAILSDNVRSLSGRKRGRSGQK